MSPITINDMLRHLFIEYQGRYFPVRDLGCWTQNEDSVDIDLNGVSLGYDSGMDLAPTLVMLVLAQGFSADIPIPGVVRVSCARVSGNLAQSARSILRTTLCDDLFEMGIPISDQDESEAPKTTRSDMITELSINPDTRDEITRLLSGKPDVYAEMDEFCVKIETNTFSPEKIVEAVMTRGGAFAPSFFYFFGMAAANAIKTNSLTDIQRGLMSAIRETR